MSESPSTAKEYYALCVKWEEGERYEVAPLHLGDNEYGRVLAFAIYTSKDGPVQREDLQKYEGDTVVRKVSPRELLTAMERHVPNSVFVDGRKYRGSVLRADLRIELGLEIRHPRLLHLDEEEE